VFESRRRDAARYQESSSCSNPIATFLII